MSGLTQTAKSGLKRMAATARRARMQAAKLREARAALTVLENSRGGLAPGLAAEARDYAADHLGWRGYAPWLKLYAAVAGEFRAGWLPDNYYYGVVMPKVNGEYHHMARHRGANARLFGAGDFPDLAYLVNGLIHDVDYNVIAPDTLAGFLRARAETVVFKADHSGFGKGIIFLDTAGIDATQLAGLGNGVFQRRVVPHGFFDQFRVPALATLRLGTAIDAEGTPGLRTAYLKLGRAGHSHVVASDQLRVAVDRTSGKLSDEGFLSDWHPVARHPDTDADFAGLKFPEFAACVATVLKLHARIPWPRYVCWDVIVDAEGKVQVLEWEGGVVNFGEATQGPCFADLGWDRLHLPGPRAGSD